MPRKQLAAVAGRNLLLGPPGTPPSFFGNRGSPGARAATLSALSLAAVAEMLFEGGDGVDNVAFDEIRGNGVANDNGAGVIVHGGEAFSVHSIDSIQFNNVDANYVQITTNLPTHFVIELWFRDNLTDGDHSALFGNTDNFRIHTGRGTVTGFNWPSHRNDFNAALSWEPEVDLSSDGLFHQLLEFRDTVGGNDYIVCIDGMPVAASSLLVAGTQLNLKPSFNDRFDAAASERFGGEMGSFAAFDNGSNLTLRDCRELFETSSLRRHDMLAAPRWFILDSVNCVVPDPLLAKQVDLGDVLNDTGIRSGAIPRIDQIADLVRKTYFELEIIDQGDDPDATLLGVRKFAETGNVGDDSENPADAIYLKAGKLHDGADVILPTGTGDDEQDALTLASPITGQLFRFAFDWDQVVPTEFWVGDDVRWKGRVAPAEQTIGLEDESILDGELTASTFTGTLDPFHGRLNNARNWSPTSAAGIGDHWQVDMGVIKTITKHQIQGGNTGAEWITFYKLSYGNDGVNFTPYNNGELLTGNTNSAGIVTNVLIPFNARFIRVLTGFGFSSFTSARFEFITQDVADPELGQAALGFLETQFNWGAWLRNNDSDGNGKVRLRTKFYEMILPIPPGFDSWEAQSYTVEVTPNGVNRRQSVFDFYPVRLRSEWLFEGTGVEYLLDRSDKKTNGGATADLTAGAGSAPTLAGLQLSFASVDSIRWPRVDNADALQPNVANPDIHAFELWFRQPEFLPDQAAQCCLFRSNTNTRLGVGRGGTSLKNFPALHNNFNGLTDWESEVDLYGDNLSHQLIEAHSTVTDYVIYVDGMPVASGTNTGWIDNSKRFIINGEQSNGVDDLTRSGGDFGSLIEYKGGDRLTQINVRRLFEASALNGHDMLTNPRWFILDSVNCTVADVVAGDARDAVMGAVEDNTGIRSGAIPRNGKVYFELEIIAQGDGTGTSNLGPRKLAEPSNVGDFPDVATDGYHTDGQGAIHDSDEVSIGITGVLGTSAVGRIFQIAIDWSNGDWWMGTDNTVYAGVGGVGNPSTGANPLPALDIDFNWAMGMNILNQFGNNTVRLITADTDLNHAKPTSYVAWEDAI